VITRQITQTVSAGEVISAAGRRRNASGHRHCGEICVHAFGNAICVQRVLGRG
jgi:hypothetical protein